MRRLVCWLAMCGVGWAQTAKVVRLPIPPRVLGGSAAVPAAAVVVLKDLARQAGVIFAGRVLEVRRDDGAGYVDVVFGVDRAVRGCDGSTRYVLREWAGLWADDPQRYGVGQKLLMILAARGPSGMSAPVGGMAGKIPLVGVRQPPLAGGTGLATADAGDRREEAADLRWVEAAAVRMLAAGAKARAETAKSSGWAGPVAPGSVPVAGVGLSAVLAVLSGQ